MSNHLAKLRRAGRDVPFINWRYILFKWNDSEAEMDGARELASVFARQAAVAISASRVERDVVSLMRSVLADLADPDSPASEGAVDVYGHVSGLLTLGAGFDKEVTGRDNILLGGARRAANPVVESNYTYYTPRVRHGGENNLGYNAGCSNLIARPMISSLIHRRD